MDQISIVFAIVSAIVLLVYVRDSWRGIKGIAPLAASLITSAFVIYVLSPAIGEIATFFVLDFALLFSVLPFYYANDTRKLLLFLAITLLGFVYATNAYGSLLYQFVAMFAIGTGYGVFYRSGLGAMKRKHTRVDRDIEVKRDVVHIGLGIVVFAVFLAFNFYNAVLVTIALIFIGYIYNSLLGTRRAGRLFSVLNRLERAESLYGLGALYLGVGVALLMGFVHDQHFILIGISALFFADPLATIVGMNIKGPKLPHSKKKSLFGSIAFFAAVSIMGFPFIGLYSLLFGAFLALVESFDTKVDDNIVIPVVMILLYIVFLASVNQLPVLQLMQQL